MLYLKHLIYVLIIALAIFFLTVFITVNASFLIYRLAINYFNLNYVSGLDSTSLMKCYFLMVKYIQVPWDTQLNLIFFKSSAKGLLHFYNVKQIIMFNNVALVAFGIMGMDLVKRLSKQGMLWTLVNPFKIILTGSLILLSLALVNFQSFFINFHRLVFRNQDWVFNIKTDPVIKVLPTPFFGWCFIVFLMIWLLLMSLSIRYFEKHN